MTYLMMCLMTFAFIFCKAFQQRNVIHDNWKLVPIFTLSMAVLETATVAMGVMDISKNGWISIIPIAVANGIGGTFGCWGAMFLHNRYFKRGGIHG